MGKQVLTIRHDHQQLEFINNYVAGKDLSALSDIGAIFVHSVGEDAKKDEVTLVSSQSRKCGQGS